ncbi:MULTISPECIES: hypothetical protein [Arthrobacter]|uniref:hypothetical protein n=1 Tax=Arthrobacter TaxID=1663 RepID=UPI00197AAF66|nr:MULTISPECIES: hypothetical protein [Arthrobacter]
MSPSARSVTESILAKLAVDEAARLAALAREAVEAGDHTSAVGHLVRLFNVQS